MGPAEVKTKTPIRKVAPTSKNPSTKNPITKKLATKIESSEKLAPGKASVENSKTKPQVAKKIAADKSKLPRADLGSLKVKPSTEATEALDVVDNRPPTKPEILEKIRGMQSGQEKRKDFAQAPTARAVLTHTSKLAELPKDPAKDRLILMVRDPYWLHACWDITRKSVERAKASLAGHWHAAKPILRLLRSEDNTTTNNSESVFRDIEIHGGVRNWYLDVNQSETTFRVLLGYLFGNNRFHELARSNPVTTPVPGSSDAMDDHWADIAQDADRVYALSGGYDEESRQTELQQMMQDKLKRPVGTPAMSQFGTGAEGSLKRSKNFHFTLDAEMVVFGTTHANAYVTLNGEPIKIRSDGTYSARVPLPNHRQVMAATSKSGDGLDEQTIVIAVERNTKIMEPLSLTEPDME